jgi:cobalt-zinc-cadmium efflux system protein
MDRYHHHHPKSLSGDTCLIKDTEKHRLLVVFFINLGIMIAEVITGFLTNSLALLSDALHMFIHALAVGISLGALLLALRGSAKDKTFRFWRIEIIAALFNGIILLPLVGLISLKAYSRFIQLEPVDVVPMLIVAIIGLLGNITCAMILYPVSREDLNIKGAFLHMLADSAASVSVVMGGVTMVLAKWYVIDPIVAFLIAGLTLIWAFRLIRDSVRILLEAVPSHMSIEEVRQTLREHPEIAEVHDLHIWTITSRFYSLTAHIVLKRDLQLSQVNNVRESLEKILDRRYNIIHSVFQFEPLDQAGAQECAMG